MAAVNYLLTQTIAGSAYPASDLAPTVLPSNGNIKDPIASLATKIKQTEKLSQKHTYSDKVIEYRI